MFVGNAIDLLMINIRKNLASVIIVTVGLFLTVFISLSVISQKFAYRTIDKALNGRAEGFGWVEINQDYDSISDHEKAMALVDKLIADGIAVNATYSVVTLLGDAAFPTLVDQYFKLHIDSEYVSAWCISPLFFDYCGLQLQKDLTWEEVLSAMNDCAENEAVILLGSDYCDVKPGTKIEIVVNDADESYTVIYKILGHFKPNQEMVTENVIDAIGNDLAFTKCVDSEVFIAGANDNYRNAFFIDSENEAIQNKITSLAEEMGVPHSELTICNFLTYFDERYRDVRAINTVMRKSLILFLPAFISFIVFLQYEMFMAERKHLGLLMVCGFSSRYLITIELVKCVIVLLLSVCLTYFPLAYVLPNYYGTDLREIMRVALSERVLPIVALLILVVLAIQLVVVAIGIKNNNVVDIIREE